MCNTTDELVLLVEKKLIAQDTEKPDEEGPRGGGASSAEP